MGPLANRLQAVRREVEDAADSVGRDPSEITIIAVTKTVGIDEVGQAARLGVVDFGENRVQEFLGKYGLFPDLRWHFIGTLQTNKVKDVVGRAYLIHSVDSLHLLEKIDQKAAEIGVVQPVLLQVNVSGERSKHGFEVAEMVDVLGDASRMENVAVRGLMTMAPAGSPEVARATFEELRELRDSLSMRGFPGVELNELSMGMSGDYIVAIEQGATMVRIGTALFGR